MSLLLPRSLLLQAARFSRTYSRYGGIRQLASKAPELPDDEVDKPKSFLKSDAAKWSATDTLEGPNPRKHAPWYEMYVVLFSVTAFLVYFCILREESDIDDSIYRPLGEKIPGMEEQQLIVRHRYNAKEGRKAENVEIEKRMRELKMDVEAIKKENLA